MPAVPSAEREHPSVLFIIERLMVGGAERYFLAKTRAMAARGCRVCVASSGGPLLAELHEAGVPWIQLRGDVSVPASMTATNLIEDAHHVAAAARAFGADVVDCVAGAPFMLGMLLHDLAGLPVVFETLAPKAALPPDLGPALRRLAQRGAVFAASDHDARDQAAAADLAPERVRVIPLPVDVERFRPQDAGEVRQRLHLPPDLTVVVTAARMLTDKAEYIGCLIDTLVRLLPQEPRLALIATGDGPMRAALRQHAQAAGLQAYFPGFVVQMEDVYACADICVGSGTTALEAAACGRPAVLAAWPPHEAHSLGYWGDDAYGCLGTPYPGSTWRSLDEVLRPLVADPDERRRRGELSRERVVQRHRLEDVMDRWYGVYAELACHGLPAPVGGAAR